MFGAAAPRLGHRSDLPYPEGVAAAELLKVAPGSVARRKRRGLKMIVLSSLVSAAYAILAQTKLAVTEAREASTSAPARRPFHSLSMALIGVGHLVAWRSGSRC